MSADEVVAVRPGLRIAFSRASRPGVWNARSIGQPTSAATGRTMWRAVSAMPTKTSTAPPAIEAMRAVAGPSPNRPESSSASPPTETIAGDPGRQPPGTARGLGRAGQRLHGRHAGGAQSGSERREQRHADADAERHRDRARRELHPGERDAEAGGVEQPAERSREAESAEQPERRGDEAEDQRLAGDRGDDLAARRAQGAQQRELARALGDGDREGVEDDEGADEQRGAGEREQHRRHEAADRLVDVVGHLLGVVRAGPHLEVGGGDLADARRERLGRHAVLGGGDDAHHLAVAVEPLLHLRQRRRDQARPADGVDVAVLEDARRSSPARRRCGSRGRPAGRPAGPRPRPSC